MVGEPDFVAPFAAQMIGIMRAFSQFLDGASLPELSEWGNNKELDATTTFDHHERSTHGPMR